MNQKQMTNNTVTILLVEDNPDHAELVMRSFAVHQIANKIYQAHDGAEALDYLFQRASYSDPQTSPRPNVILLDLNLPRINGLEVLKKIKDDRQLRNIPVVILTTSEAEQDIAKAYEYHANSYLVKPIDYDKFTKLMDELGVYWLAWNHQPTK